MKEIEKIWDIGNKEISDDKSYSIDFIRKSISERSISISATLLKSIWMGIVFCSISVIGFIYNLFFYLNNIPITLTIITLILLSSLIIVFLVSQTGHVRKTDRKITDLKSLLVTRIKYFNKQFPLVLHCISFSVVLVTFVLNLTMENNDGVFEIRKILILSTFYLFSYFMIFFLMKITHNSYLRQLRSALLNLEEGSLEDMDEELKRYKRIRKWIIGVLLIVLLSGIIALVIKTVM